MENQHYYAKNPHISLSWIFIYTALLMWTSCAPTGPALEGVLADVCPPIPSLVATLEGKSQITIVAIGSSSIKGVGASAPEKTFPAQLEKMLKNRFPNKNIVVLNKGVNGDRIEQMFQRFQSDVLFYAPDLVVWQTGINDALQNKIPAFISKLPMSMEFLKGKVHKLIIMDFQYTGVKQDLSQIFVQETLLNEAAKQSVDLLPRYKLMQEIVKRNIYSLDKMLYTDSLHLNDFGYEILSRCAMSRIS